MTPNAPLIVAPSILLEPSLRQSAFAADRALWWHQQADAYAEAGDALWERRCRNEAAFWEADASPLAELIEGIEGGYPHDEPW